MDIYRGDVMDLHKEKLNIVSSLIKTIDYFELKGDRLTLCVVELFDGDMITGSSICNSPGSYNQDLHRETAYHNAIDYLYQSEQALSD